MLVTLRQIMRQVRAAPTLDDGVPCTIDACDATDGVTHTPDDSACDDSDVCTENDECLAGVCTGDQLPDTTTCDDGVSCTENDQCTAGECAGTALDCSSLDGDCTVGVCKS